MVPGSRHRSPEDYRLFAALGRFTVRFRWLIIAGWIITTVVLVLRPPLPHQRGEERQLQLPARLRAQRAGPAAGRPVPVQYGQGHHVRRRHRRQASSPPETRLPSSAPSGPCARFPGSPRSSTRGRRPTVGPAGRWSRSRSRRPNRTRRPASWWPGCGRRSPPRVHHRAWPCTSPAGWRPRWTSRTRTATSRASSSCCRCCSSWLCSSSPSGPCWPRSSPCSRRRWPSSRPVRSSPSPPTSACRSPTSPPSSSSWSCSGPAPTTGCSSSSACARSSDAGRASTMPWPSRCARWGNRSPSPGSR